MPAARTLARPLVEMEPLDAAARVDARHLVRMVALLTRAPSAEDDLYDATIASGEPETARFARLLKARRVLDARERLRIETVRPSTPSNLPVDSDPWGLSGAPAPASAKPTQDQAPTPPPENPRP